MKSVYDIGGMPCRVYSFPFKNVTKTGSNKIDDRAGHDCTLLQCKIDFPMGKGGNDE